MAIAFQDIYKSVVRCRYLGGFVVGIPVFVFRDYFQSRLSLEWREWMTRSLLDQYLGDRSFYQLQAGGMVDNPDQRIASGQGARMLRRRCVWWFNILRIFVAVSQ